MRLKRKGGECGRETERQHFCSVQPLPILRQHPLCCVDLCVCIAAQEDSLLFSTSALATCLLDTFDPASGLYLLGRRGPRPGCWPLTTPLVLTLSAPAPGSVPSNSTLHVALEILELHVDGVAMAGMGMAGICPAAQASHRDVLEALQRKQLGDSLVRVRVAAHNTHACSGKRGVLLVVCECMSTCGAPGDWGLGLGVSFVCCVTTRFVSGVASP